MEVVVAVVVVGSEEDDKGWGNGTKGLRHADKDKDKG